MKNKISNLQNLFQLMKENPGVEIIPFVNGNVLQAPECDYTMSKLGYSVIDEYCVYGDKLYTDRYEFMEDWMADNDDWLDAAEAEDKAYSKANELFKKAIFLYIEQADCYETD